MKSKVYYYIYKITILKGSWKDHYYIGQHETNNLNDGYKGSGAKIRNWYKSKERIEGIDYIKEILCYCSSWEEMQLKEDEYIGDKYDTDILCLNEQQGGHNKLSKEVYKRAGKTHSKWCKEHPEEVSKRAKQAYINYPEKRDKIRNNNHNRAQNPEYKLHASKLQKEIQNRPDVKEKRSNSLKITLNIPENKIARGNAIKKAKADPEKRKRQSEISSNTIYVNNGIKCKRIKKELEQDFLNKGYIRGLLKNDKPKKIYINNGIKCKKIKIEELEYYLTLGWIKGGLSNKTGSKWMTNGIETKQINKDEIQKHLNIGYIYCKPPVSDEKKKLAAKKTVRNNE